MIYVLRWDARGSRSEFWWFHLMSIVLFAVAGGVLLGPILIPLTHAGYESIEAMKSGQVFRDEDLAALQVIEAIAAMETVLKYMTPFYIWFIVAGISASIRRLHDSDHSGWWYLITLVPIIGFFWYLFLMILPSYVRKNEWGPAPDEDPAKRAKREAALEPYMQPRSEMDAICTADEIRSLRHSRMPST